MDFSFISDIINAFLNLIPRPMIIRATHAGVCWRLGSKIIEMKPGWRWWWPLISEVEIIPIARQTSAIPSQGLLTRDQKQIAVGAVIIFSINDVVQAIGHRNWDVESTVGDITAAAIVRVVTKWELKDLLAELTDKVEDELTTTCRQQLRQFGVRVHRCKFTDFTTCRVYKLMGSTPMPTELEG